MTGGGLIFATLINHADLGYLQLDCLLGFVIWLFIFSGFEAGAVILAAVAGS